jgi:MoxR-like ATPase
MQERQVTIGDQTFKLDHPFLVLATQNPIEQEGTYPLPEAQVDRFMLKVKVDYPPRRRSWSSWRTRDWAPFFRPRREHRGSPPPPPGAQEHLRTRR